MAEATPTGCPQTHLDATGTPAPDTPVNVGQHVHYDFTASSDSGPLALMITAWSFTDVSATTADGSCIVGSSIVCHFYTDSGTVSFDGNAAPTTSGRAEIEAEVAAKDICLDRAWMILNFPLAATPTGPATVGGAAMLPPASITAEFGAPADDSGRTAETWAILAGVATGVVALATGTWYLKKRRNR